MNPHHGRFAWYELLTDAPAAARDFYAKVVGWQVQDSGMPGVDYGLFTVNGVPIGGSMALADGMGADGKPGWIGYVAVDDVDASAADFAANGGKLHMGPHDIPGVGRFAIVSDPQGATIALITEAVDATAARLKPMEPGHGSWHELLSPDPAAALDFYAGRFGWRKGDAIDMGPMGTYQLYGPGDQIIGGMMRRPDGFDGPAWCYYFDVDAIDAAVDRVKAAGGTVVNGPMEVPGGAWIIQAIDPQGAMFALVAPKR
ncbi:MAG: VOC family protein [Sphingomonas sp.]|nr:VOC family protein [Sphingomonas sp.]MDX3883050.1 VOC family protein [Sphingomonas sp.]